MWLKKWKEYVDYAYVKKNLQFSQYYSHYSNLKYQPKLDQVPTKIDNTPLLVPMDSFLNDGDDQNPENIVIKHNINQREQVKIVNKEIWEFFQKKYEGGPVILRGAIEEKSRYSSISKKIIEVYYNRVLKFFT